MRIQNISTQRLVDLSQKTYVVDKLHIAGHKSSCLTKFDPYLFPELKKANTMVCEQINFRYSGYKFILKHMNKDKHTSYPYIIFNGSKKITCEGRFNLENQVPTYNTRNFDEFGEEDFFTNLPN